MKYQNLFSGQKKMQNNNNNKIFNLLSAESAERMV